VLFERTNFPLELKKLGSGADGILNYFYEFILERLSLHLKGED
jgi:hypothetical protein